MALDFLSHVSFQGMTRDKLYKVASSSFHCYVRLKLTTLTPIMYERVFKIFLGFIVN